MNDVIAYTTVERFDRTALIKEVNEKIVSGWIPLGGVYVYGSTIGTILGQAMIAPRAAKEQE